MRILVVRHGESEKNVRGIASSAVDAPFHLTEKGKEQARKVGESLTNVQHIICSEVVRARETAEIINSFLNINIEYDARLNEEDLGDLELKSREDVHAFRKKDFEKRFPGGESLADVKRNVLQLVEELKEKKLDNVLIVTHGAGLSGIYRHVNNIPDGAPFEHPPKTGTIHEFTI